MKKIFISGASGYIGSNLATLLSKKGYRIICLTKKKKINLSNTVWIKGNLSGNYQKYLKDTDLIIHCAAAGVYKKEREKKIYKVNYHDSFKFLKKAFDIGCRNWIILGSSSEYGFLKNKPMSVKYTKLKPVNAYGKSKVLLFKKLFNSKMKKKTKILYLRIFHVYGSNEPKKRIYRGLIEAIKKKKDFKMTQGEEIRDFVNIDYITNKIYKSFKLFNRKSFFKVKHIAKGKPIKVKEFAKYHWKKNKAKKKILFGAISKEHEYHTMFSDKSSLI